MADEQKGTEYKVLIPQVEAVTAAPEDDEVRERIVPRAWREIADTWTAANDVAAIKAAAEAHGPFEHGAVAVPARSWRPRKREVKSVQRELWT